MMNEPKEFFSPNQKRLLSIAVWAKYLTWVVLIVYILWTIATYLQEQSMFLYCNVMGNMPVSNFMDALKQIPSYGLGILIEMIGVLLKGIVYFLVLKGISLGLNMIVETNVNYREQEKQGGAG
jgi:hypothetical protein